MKFLANENIPLATVNLLEKNSINIKAIAVYSPGITDLDVINIANNEDRIILTFDKDYGEIVFNKKVPSAGIVYFKFIPKYPEEPGEILLKVLKNKQIDFKNKFTVIERKKIRQKNLKNA